MNKKSYTKVRNLTYLGPEGSYTEIAAEKLLEKSGIKEFNRNIKSSILQVIESIDNNNDDIGVIPIENSIEGIVRESVDNLVKTTSRVIINGEIIIPINHCLISKSKNLDNINVITSHPQALAQCQYFIDRNFKNVELIPASSTSEAVKNIAELPENYAAIGTSKAAGVYGLTILQTNINDIKDNLTRFISIGSKIAEQTGNDKTSIAFSIMNQPGALVEILEVFNKNNLNLSYIESRPSKKVFGDYTFFIDFEGHIEDENVQKTIGKIAPLVSFYRFLGSYPKAQDVSE